MNYISTRDETAIKTAAQAILQGISADGGLFVPQELPQVTLEFVQSFVGLTYPRRAATIMRLFLTDFEPSRVFGCAAFAYEGVFENNTPAPVVQLDENMHMLELWHGPTLAFKDMALQMLPQLMNAAKEAENNNKTAVVLVATSGDTGKAALEGFSGVDGTKIAVFYPNGKVSPMQRLQMVTQRGQNVFVQAVDGNFDNCQSAVKEMLADEYLAKRATDKRSYFTSANSINWGRLLPQIIYYFSAYADLLKNGSLQLGETLNVSVPTGNFGDILAAYYAKKMGLPLGKLICASNKNDVLTQFINTGKYSREREFFTTNTPSMDILISSNLERLLYHSCENDAEVAGYMAELSQNGEYTVSAELIAKIAEDFVAFSCDEEKISSTIAKIKADFGYTCDPHTAVAVSAAMDYKANAKTLIVSTASPFKFAGTVLAALGESVEEDEFARLQHLSDISGLKIPQQLLAMREAQERFTDVCTVEEMPEKLLEFLRK